MLKKFEIKQDETPIGLCLVKEGDWYVIGYCNPVNSKKSSIEINGSIRITSNQDIFNIFVKQNDEYFKVECSKNDLAKILKFKRNNHFGDEVDKAMNAYSNISEIRRLSQIEFIENLAVLSPTTKIDQKKIGYIMQRALRVAKNDHKKATEIFIEDLKSLNLKITNI